MKYHQLFFAINIWRNGIILVFSLCLIVAITCLLPYFSSDLAQWLDVMNNRVAQLNGRTCYLISMYSPIFLPAFLIGWLTRKLPLKFAALLCLMLLVIFILMIAYLCARGV